MEPPKAEMKFPRQPKPVKVTLDCEQSIDNDMWAVEFSRRAEALGCQVVFKHRNIFTIYPRAVND